MASRDRSPPRDSAALPEMRSALQYSIGLIARHEESESNTRPLTGSSVATLTVVAMKYIEVMSADLRAFSKHAKRAGITCDDVKLLARKMPELGQQLEDFEAAHLTKDTGGGGAAKKRKAADSKKAAKGSSNKHASNTRVVDVDEYEHYHHDDSRSDFQRSSHDQDAHRGGHQQQRGGKFASSSSSISGGGGGGGGSQWGDSRYFNEEASNAPNNGARNGPSNGGYGGGDLDADY